MSETPPTPPPDRLDPHDPLWRATVEMAEHARDPDVPEDSDLDGAVDPQDPRQPPTPG